MQPIETPFGEMDIYACDDDTIRMDGNSNGKFITVNRVAYATNVTLKRNERNEWDIDKKYLFMHRTRTYEDATTSASRKVIETLTPICNEWANNNVQAIREAAIEDAKCQLKMLQIKLEDAETVLIQITHQIVNCNTKLQMLGVAIPNTENENGESNV